MLHGLEGGHSLLRHPVETSCLSLTLNKVQKHEVLDLQLVFERLAPGHPGLALRVDQGLRTAVQAEKFAFPGRELEQGVGGTAQDLHDRAQLVTFAFPLEQGLARDQLDHNAGEGPHVDGAGVGNPENDLRSPVDPALYVEVNLFVVKARGAEVDDLDQRLLAGDQNYVFGLQVTVDYVVVGQETQAFKCLDRESSDQSLRKSFEAVGLEQVVEVEAEQLEDYAQVASEPEVTRHLNEAPWGAFVVFFEVTQDLELDLRLLFEPFVTFEDLNCHFFFGFVVEALADLREGPGAQHLEDLVLVGYVVPEHQHVVCVLVVEASVLEFFVWTDFSGFQPEVVYKVVVGNFVEFEPTEMV